ncbi:MAG: acyl-CoA dehydrogenase family protein [Chloroflexi bacterium]|nr:acyl-CoA dehydrogenase family protein [Chloroflexota bacterium]
MEFELQYTPEQEAFRKEVHAWLEANAVMPASLGEVPLDEMDTTPDQWAWTREFHRKLGAKGWLYATMPTQYGGGGMELGHDIVLKQELGRFKYPAMTSPGNVAMAHLMVYGTEEQKKRFLTPMLRGETITWQLWTEPDSGVDLASIKTRAIADGDDFVFNGVKMYISGLFEPDWLNILAVTDPEAPRHANLGQFYIPANLPGISWEFQDLINNGGQHFIYFDEVRVSREYLIGGETQGWRVTQSSLELEHGAEGRLDARENTINELLEKWKTGSVNSLAHGAAAREHLVDAYIRNNVSRLFGRRNFWMFNTHQEQSYEGPQNLHYGREVRIKTADDMLDLLGMHALVRNPEVQLLGGKVEKGQRGATMATHGAGSYEIDKVIISRRIGLSRTKDVAAPTH